MLDRLVTAPSEPARLPSGGRALGWGRLQMLASHANGIWRGLPGLVLVLILGAWAFAIVAHGAGWGRLLSHDQFIKDGAGLWPTLGLFLVGWLMMVAAMMLPSSLAASRSFEAVAQRSPRRVIVRTAFLGGYLAWLTVFGIAALTGDILLHGLVDAWPWLGVRPWLIGGTTLTLAGGFELWWRSKRSRTYRVLAPRLSRSIIDSARATQLGLDHGRQQLRRCWPLMLLSFAVGMTNLAWMAGLTLVMMLDGPRGGRVAGVVAGAFLLAMGALVIVHPGWLPVFLPV